MKTFSEVATLVIDANRGIYIAQEFAKKLTKESIPFMGVDKSDIKILLLGPDNDQYVDVWADKLESCTLPSPDGEYSIMQVDGDLWAYIPSEEIDFSETEY